MKKQNVGQYVFSFVMGFALFFVLNSCFVMGQVEGISMNPTLAHGQKTIINKISLKLGAIERSDVVVFYPTQKRDVTFVKRVIAVPGDEIEIRENIVYVNDVAIDEPYINEPMVTADVPALTLLPGEYYVMGDNRNFSGDSRSIGAIRKEWILGKLPNK